MYPQHVECNVVNYNNPTFYEDGYLSDSVSNCSYSTVAESEIVGARIKRHEQEYLNQQKYEKDSQNNNNSDKYQVVNIIVDKLHIYGDNEGNQQAIQDFENPIKEAINDILKPSSNYGKTLPVISDCNSLEISHFETVTEPVKQSKAIKCFKFEEIIKNRKHLTALIIVLIILTMTAILLLFGLRKGNIDTKPESNVEDIPSVKKIEANSLETPVIEKRLESITELQTIARDSWKSMKNKVGKRKQLIPIQRVIIMETGADSCTTLEGCKQFLQHKQNKDYPKADDIKENFFVGLDGKIYEGRGWSREGQHTYDSAGTSYNSQAIGLCLIGKFTKKTPKALQWNATVLFLEKALINNQLSVDYKIFHQKQLIGGIDDNNNLYQATKMLKNWKRTPDIIHRNEWRSSNVTRQITKSNRVPMSEVIISNETKGNCETKDACVNILKKIQNSNQIMENFIFGGNDLIFEGRSFDDNQGSLLIGHIPENSTNPITPSKLEEFLTFAVDLGKLDKNYTITRLTTIYPGDNNTESTSDKQ